MGKLLKSRVFLSIAGFIQVFFVSIVTYFTVKENYLVLAVASFMLNAIWNVNVKKIVFGNWVDNVLYSASAACGCVSGVMFAKASNGML